eukprot:SAG31_NODE_8994_length_1351_cov_1.313898_2_plen_46_part_00
MSLGDIPMPDVNFEDWEAYFGEVGEDRLEKMEEVSSFGRKPLSRR